MRIWLIVALGMLVAACENPQVGVGARITPDGVKVVPTISGGAGNARVVVRP